MSDLRLFVVDNYDSFTYNLVQYLGELMGGVDKITVRRNDKFEIADIEDYDAIIVSPGPGVPEESGLTKEVIRHYSGKKPILGVCLGLQSIVEVFGGSLVNLSEVYHGISTPIQVTKEDRLFGGLARPIQVGRYHSWVAGLTDFPKDLIVLAVDDKQEVMALRHKEHPTVGVQFHPESILTPEGQSMLANFLTEAKDFIYQNQSVHEEVH